LVDVTSCLAAISWSFILTPAFTPTVKKMTMVRTKKSITGLFKNFTPQDVLRQLFSHIFMPFVNWGLEEKSKLHTKIPGWGRVVRQILRHFLELVSKLFYRFDVI
jgi:hypothetical protein